MSRMIGVAGLVMLGMVLTGPSADAADVDRTAVDHYDGARGEETIIQVWGMGPATATPVEKR
jgi:hypothetical protein